MTALAVVLIVLLVFETIIRVPAIGRPITITVRSVVMSSVINCGLIVWIAVVML